MKRFWIVAWDQYYPGEALDNVIGWCDTIEEANERIASLEHLDHASVVDMDTWKPGDSFDYVTLR